MVFQSMDVIDMYFQSRILSKFSIIPRLVSFLFFSGIRLLLIKTHLPVQAFAIAMAMEASLSSLLLVFSYKAAKVGSFPLRFETDIAKRLIKDCWPLIFSSVLVLIYMRIDQIMLRYLSTPLELGKYSAAVRVAEMWYFVPISIVSSVFPKIIGSLKDSKIEFNSKLQRLYITISAVGYMAAIPIMIFADPLIHILYGDQYTGAGPMLSLLAWSGLFVGMGAARSSFLMSMNLTKFHFFSAFMGCLCNRSGDILPGRTLGYGAPDLFFLQTDKRDRIHDKPSFISHPSSLSKR
jgi:O-antigen/teichoic acid export membrane protein